MTEEFTTKQVIIIRKDLKIGAGKLASQACHACLEASEEAKKHDLKIWKIWREEGAKKVILKANSLRELLELRAKAENAALPFALIVDRGLTQLTPNTPTALGIGPGEANKIDEITGHLKLL